MYVRESAVPGIHGSGVADKCTLYQDQWVFNGRVLVRIHNRPRQHLFYPDSTHCPIPLKFLDVTRETRTDILGPLESHSDIWTSSNPMLDPEYSRPWTGSTSFNLIRPAPPPGPVRPSRAPKISKEWKTACLGKGARERGGGSNEARQMQF